MENSVTSASLSSVPLYTREFFQLHRDGSRRSAEVTVPLLIERFEPRSVVDVGCGTGIWLSVFREHGVADILGIDGPWLSASQRDVPAASFREWNLIEPLGLGRSFDLALCLEVAEHLPEEAADRFVESLTALAPVIVFSAAIPDRAARDTSMSSGRATGQSASLREDMCAPPVCGRSCG